MVLREMFPDTTPPPVTSRQYWPTDRDVYNYVYRASTHLRQGKTDQENVIKMCDGLRDRNPEDNVFFRLCQEMNADTVVDCCSGDMDLDEYVAPQADHPAGMLFVYQTAWQRHLVKRYGGEIFLLDATYRTMRYALPLFFVCIPTNVKYMVVGVFITQYESQPAIAEALEKLKSWNEDWCPKYAMTDLCDAEISAIHSTFPGKVIYLYIFSSLLPTYSPMVNMCNVVKLSVVIEIFGHTLSHA